MTIYFNNRIVSAMEWETLDALLDTQPARHSYRYIDPTGMNPVYDRNGVFWGCTSEGFTGEVLVMRDGLAFFTNLGKFSANQLYKVEFVKTLDVIQQFKDKNSRLSNDALSAIWTNILQHFNGLQVYDEIFTTFDMEGQRVFFEKDDDSNWATYYLCDPPKIVGSGKYFGVYESTVENIASSIIVHEWYSHGMKHNGDLMLSHRLAYKNVINFTPLWNKTTPSYKRFVLRKLKDYTEKETGRSLVDKPYRYSYKIYVSE
jgi:hypothetical protein